MSTIASNRQAVSGEHGPATPEPTHDDREKLLAEFRALGEELHAFRRELIEYQNRVRRILLDLGEGA